MEKVSSFCGVFVAVDCSTRTLKRANNWGVYLMRAAYAFVKEREVVGVPGKIVYGGWGRTYS